MQELQQIKKGRSDTIVRSMANSFLPLGYQPQSEEEIKMTEEKDRTTAQILIMQGKTIPSDRKNQVQPD